MVVDDPTKCWLECLEECDSPEPGSAICPTILKPVGCTYDNVCLAEAAGFEEAECKLVNDTPPSGVALEMTTVTQQSVRSVTMDSMSSVTWTAAKNLAQENALLQLKRPKDFAEAMLGFFAQWDPDVSMRKGTIALPTVELPTVKESAFRVQTVAVRYTPRFSNLWIADCDGCTYNNQCLDTAAGFKKKECKLVNDPPPSDVCFGNDECNTKAGEICYTGFNGKECDEDCGDESCPGKSVVQVETKKGLCGGFAGFPCPKGSSCVDAKGDKCSPNCGGADCGGICIRDNICPKSGMVICPQIKKPVDCAGCTYSNLCLAEAAGFTEKGCKSALVGEHE